MAQNTRSRPELAERVAPKSGNFRASKKKTDRDDYTQQQSGDNSEAEAFEKSPGARLQNLQHPIDNFQESDKNREEIRGKRQV